MMSATLTASATGVRPTAPSRSAALRPLAVAVPRSTPQSARRPDVVARVAVAEAPAIVAPSASASASASAGVHALDAATFHTFLAENADKLCVVDFFTEWCGPCKMIAPELERLAREADPTRVVYAKLNCGATNDTKKLAVALGIKALPTFHLYRASKVQSSMTGAKVKALQELVQKHI